MPAGEGWAWMGLDAYRTGIEVFDWDRFSAPTCQIRSGESSRLR